MRTYSRYRATASFGSVEFTVDNWYTSPEQIKHEAWRALWDGPAKKMLKRLCDELGVDLVKSRFEASITYELLS